MPLSSHALFSHAPLSSALPQARLILSRLEDLKEGAESMRELMEANQRRVLSSEHAQWEPLERSPDVSISITTETGQTTVELEAELSCPTPEEPRLPSPSACRRLDESRQEVEPAVGGAREAGGRGRRVVPPDVVQRSHALVYPDITNFLSVESRGHHGVASRYSESNFRFLYIVIHIILSVLLYVLYIIITHIMAVDQPSLTLLYLHVPVDAAAKMADY